jgi:Helix-turn-helix domain
VSLKITSLVWERGPKQKKDHAEFVVLLALAEFADASGLCWPSIETIAARARFSKSSVIRSLKNLETGGWLSVTRKSREHKGNTYQIALDRLDSDGSVTPDLVESSASVTPETPRVRCHPVSSQVSPSVESGVKSAKPPDPLKGRTVKNRQEPRTKRTQAFVLPKGIPIEPWNHFLEMRKSKRNTPTDHAKHLLIEKLARWAASGQDPGAILDRSTENGWAGVFELKPGSGNGNGNRNFNRAQEAVDSTLAGGRAALASFGFNCGPLNEIGFDDGGANGQGRRPVTVDGRRARRLAGG